MLDRGLDRAHLQVSAAVHQALDAVGQRALARLRPPLALLHRRAVLQQQRDHVHVAVQRRTEQRGAPALALAAKVTVPDLPFQSHSAPLHLSFYAARGGAAGFPASFDGDAFVTFHGSWNRSLRTGYKLVHARMRDGRPTGDYEDFVTGFIAADGNVWGRPVATLELDDGSLLLSDDASNTVWRIVYTPPVDRST